MSNYIDIIFAAPDLAAFRVELPTITSHLISVEITESHLDNIVRILPATTMIEYNGNKSVATVRCSEEDALEFDKVTTLIECGRGVGIKSAEDVVWSNKELYYASRDMTPKPFTDEDGVTHTFTPYPLHCVFA